MSIIRKLSIGIILLVLSSTVLYAVDRHVYLNSTGGGSQLNDCPNPAHNAKGTSNTDELQYCVGGGATAGKVIGTATGRITSGACTTDGGDGVGVVTAVTNGVQADVDGDGTNEFVYGHPQACVWNMAPSDDCDIHSGTYQNAGARCQEDCGDRSAHNIDVAADQTASLSLCDVFDCWFASVAAFGHGPNLSNNGYGTAGDPSYLRAANSNGSIDSWDNDNDKIPNTVEGVTGYPVIMSGDRDGDGTFDQTDQPSGSLSGDTFHTVLVGCINSDNTSNPTGMCGDSFVAAERGIEIDTDADGIFDTELHEIRNPTYYDRRRVSYFKIKDIEFTRYNGGNNWNSTYDNEQQLSSGRFGFHGSNYGDVGIAVDHIYMVDNDANFSNARTCLTDDTNNGCMKTMWAEFSDRNNYRCAQTNQYNHTEISNSLVHWSTARVATWTDNGCPLSMHDNRIIIDHVNNPTRLNVIPTGGSHKTNIFYFKDVDRTVSGSPEVQRVWNNEWIIKNGAHDSFRFFDIQNFGNAEGAGLGEIWFYGNLVRNDPALVTATDMDKFNAYFCNTADNADGSQRFYLFNNTFDGMDIGGGWEHDNVCNGGGSPGPGELLVDRNNVFWDITEVCIDDASDEFTTIRRAFSCNASATQSPACPSACATSTKSNWFDDTSTTPTYWNGLALYSPQPSGNLVGTGSCDPDGNGTNGVDYDGDGTVDHTWIDIAGNVVSCPITGNPVIDIGAIQSSSATTGVCEDGIIDLGEDCDSTALPCLEGAAGCDLGGNTCISLGFPLGGTLNCNSDCTIAVSGCVTAIRSIPQGVKKHGSIKQ